MPKVIEKVKDCGMNDVVFLLGGIIPQQDIPGLLEKGVAAVFGPGTQLQEIMDFAFEQVAMKKAEKLVEQISSGFGAKKSNI